MFEMVAIFVIALALLVGYLIGRRFGPERVETIYVWKEVPIRIVEQQQPVAAQKAQSIVIGGPTKGFGVN
jgi:hypothetical protein